MVHKKYTYKDGKRFGPYYYETKRVNGEVVTTYLGSKYPRNNKKFILPIFIFGLIAVLLLLFFFFQGFTGRVSLDIDSKFNPGELIRGNLRLNINQGELVPADSVLKINYNGEEKEFVLSDLISDSPITGNFYAENSGISGNGEGYGIIGVKKIYPEVNFGLEVYEDSGQSSDNTQVVSNKSDAGSSGDESPADSTSDAEPEVLPDSGTSESSDSGSPSDSSIVDNVQDNSNVPIDSGTSGSDSGTSESSDSGTGSDSGVSDSGSSASSGDSSSGDSSGGDIGITGAVVSESGISGKVSKDNLFEYELGDGENVRIVSGSVEANGEKISDSGIKIKKKGNKAEISTDYFIEEQGFGKDFIGSKSLKLNFDLENFGINATTDGTLNIDLVYQDSSIVNVEGNVDVVEPEVNKTESIINNTNTTIITNVTIDSNITLETNTTIVNNITNITGIATNITQFGAVLGQPVKWKKRVDVSGPANVVIELPKSAENVSIQKVEKTKEEIEAENKDNVGVENNIIVDDDKDEVVENVTEVAEEIVAEKNITTKDNKEIKEKKVRIDITGEVVSGKVSADLNVKSEFAIINFFKKLIGITGRVVDIPSEIQEINVEVTDLEKAVEVEYETPAPSVGFEEVVDGKKRVGITSPDDVHYENVLIYTQLPEEMKVVNLDKIRIYWEENNSYLFPSLVEDTDGNGIYDYVEWVAPHLSNQTFDIIVITKAEHLDSNKTFISDIYSEVKGLDGNWSEIINDNEYVRVVFERNLTSEKDITIYPRNVSGVPKVEVYEKNKSVILAGFDNPIDNQYNTIYLTNLTGSQDVFDLRVVSGTMQFDHIIDPSSNYLINIDASASALGSNANTLGKNIIRLNSDKLVALWIDESLDVSCSDSTNEGVTWGTYDSLTGTHEDAAIATNGSAIVYVFINNGQKDLDFIYNTTDDCSVARSGVITDVSTATNDNWRPDVTFDGVNNRFVACSFDNDDFDLDISRTAVGNTLSWTTNRAVGGDRHIQSCSIDTTDDGNVFVSVDDDSVSGLVVFNTSEFIGVGTFTAYDANVSDQHMSIRGTEILITASDTSSLTGGNITIIKSSDGVTYTNATYTGGNYGNPEGCLDANGNAHIVFRNGTAPSNIEYVRYTAGGTFDNRALVANGGVNQYGLPSVRCTNFPANNRLGTDELELVYSLITSNDVYFANVTIDTSVPDTTAPGVKIIFPESGASYTSLPLNFNVSLNENGSVQYSLDGGINNVTMTVNNTGNGFNATNNSMANGGYTFRVYANDTIGNNNYSESVLFTLLSSDTTAPGVTIRKPQGEAYYGLSDLPLFFNVSLSKNGSVQYSLDGGINNLTMLNLSNGVLGIEFNATNTSLGSGNYIFIAYANDTNGNNNYSQSVSFSFDDLIPGVKFISPTPANASIITGNAFYVNLSTSDANRHYSFVDFNRSLVLWARMDDVHNSGDVVDLSSWSNNGTKQGDAVQVDAGFYGKGFYFDGTTDYLDFGNSDSLALNRPFTWASWIYLNDTANQGFMGKTGLSGGVSLRAVSNKLTLYDPSFQSLSGVTTLSTGKWYHIAVTYNGSYAYLYLNGTIDGNGTYTIIPDSTNNLYVGRSGTQTFYMNGTMDEVFMFSRELNWSEIKSLYDSGISRYENNFTNLNFTIHPFIAYAVDKAGNMNQTDQRKIITRPEHLKISDTFTCDNLLSKAIELGFGENYTSTCQGIVPGFVSCVSLDTNLNITNTGRLDVDSRCGIFFNATSDGQLALYLSGTLNLSGGIISAVNTVNNYNFSIIGSPYFFVDSTGNIQDANFINDINVSDSKVVFSEIKINSTFVLINSTDITSYDVGANSALERKFRLNATVKDGGAVISAVNITATNRTGTKTFSLLTNSEGSVYYNLTQYTDTGVGKVIWNNYTINYTKTGYYPANGTSVNMTTDKEVNLGLNIYSTIVVSSTETLHDIYTRINDDVILRNFSTSVKPCWYVSNANINITIGKLILESCTLEINNTFGDAEFNLYVNNGGTLSANYSNITKNSDFRFLFQAGFGSNLTIRNSYISYTGNTEAINMRRGLSINTSSVIFYNNTVSKAFDADVEILSSNIALYNSRFLGTDGNGGRSNYNIYCVFCNNVSIVDSNLSDSAISGIVVNGNQSIYLVSSNYNTHSVDPGGRLYKQWFVNVKTNDTLNNFINGVNVTFFNNTGSATESALSNSTGDSGFRISEYVVNGTLAGGVVILQSNYSVNTTKVGYSKSGMPLNVTRNLNIAFTDLNNPSPNFILNSPDNASEFTYGSLNIILNATVNDSYDDILEARIFGINSSSQADIYKHGLLYQNVIPNNSFAVYNWTSPVIVPDAFTISLFHLDNRSEYGENDTQFYDYTDNGNNGNFLGNALVNESGGKFGGGINFNGIGYTSYLFIPDSSILNMSNLTVMAWIYPGLNGYKGFIVSKDDEGGGGNEGFWFMFNYTSNATQFDTGSDSPVNSSPNSIEKNRWSHVAVTINTTTIQFYINGIASGIYEGTYSIFSNKNPLLIGSTTGTVTGPGTPGGFNGTLDEIAIWNKTLTASEIMDTYTLGVGKYNWRVNATDNGGNNNESQIRDIIINEGQLNNAPQNPTPEINSTLGTNRTLQNLHCFDTIYDQDNDAMNVTVVWYNESKVHLVTEFNNSYANGSAFDAILYSGNTTKGQNWTCGIRLFDNQISQSGWANSTQTIKVSNTPPTVPVLSTPSNGDSITDRTPVFTWSASIDDDSDVLYYDLNVTCFHISGGGCTSKGDDTRNVETIDTNSYDLGSEPIGGGDLVYLYDNSYRYNWSIRAYDDEEFSTWTESFALNVSAFIQISLPNSTIDFGSIAQFGFNDTSDNSPRPFLLQNDGNVFVNVTLSATDLWITQVNPSNYYTFKIDNYALEDSSFDWLLSKVIYTQVPSFGNNLPAIIALNYTNATDTAEIDINVTVPAEEYAGARNSTITLIASLGE